MKASGTYGSYLDTSVALKLKMNGLLRLTIGKNADNRREFDITETTIIGNDPAADIFLEDPLVCPRHARIAKEGSIWKIWDMKSENGTFVSGKLSTVSPIYPDSEIILGSTTLVAHYTEPVQIDTAMVRRSGEWVQLPRIIAHEFKNYLQFFDAGIEQICQDEEFSNRFRGEIKSLQMAGEKMDELVQMLRTGCAEPRLEEMDLIESVLEQVALIEGAAELAGVDLELDLPSEPVFIVADAGQIGRCLLNLVKNALEACSLGDCINIRITSDASSRIMVFISDTGHGMEPETLQSMWNPMFTTRAGGNGLGAFIARAVILRHNGSIEAESKPDKGTVIRIELPAVKTKCSHSDCR